MVKSWCGWNVKQHLPLLRKHPYFTHLSRCPVGPGMQSEADQSARSSQGGPSRPRACTAYFAHCRRRGPTAFTVRSVQAIVTGDGGTSVAEQARAACCSGPIARLPPAHLAAAALLF